MRAIALSASRPKRSAKLVDVKRQGVTWAVVIIVVSVVVDQTTKLWAVGELSRGEVIHVLGDFLRFSLVYNKGGAMGTSLGSSTWYLVVTLIVLPLLLFYTWRHRDELGLVIPLAFISGGAIGNLIDRIRLGHVVDFIDVDFFDINLWGFQLTRWWTFNIADACISVALVYLAFTMFFFPEPAKPTESAEDADSSSDPESSGKISY